MTPVVLLTFQVFTGRRRGLQVGVAETGSGPHWCLSTLTGIYWMMSQLRPLPEAIQTVFLIS